MTYNLYVIAADTFTSMTCGAIAILLFFQLQRDGKTRIFLTFALFESVAEASLVLARMLGFFGSRQFVPFFYVGVVLYASYPSLLLSFVAEFFDLWTPLKRWLSRVLLALPVLLFIGVVTDRFFVSVNFSAAGSFSYHPTAYAYVVIGCGELGIAYTLVLVLRHAIAVRMQAQRQLIFGLIVLLVTALLLPNEALFRAFGALGTITSMLLVTGSILRTRLFDPLTQLNRTLLHRTKRLHKAMKQNSDLLIQVQEANTAKTRFIGYISHEVRGSVSNIFTRSQMMTEHGEMYRGVLPEDYEKEIFGIRRQAEHLKILINDLLDISRIEAGELKLSIVPLDPLPILEKVHSGILAQLSPKVRLERRYDPALPKVAADETRLTQVLMNLVGNAAKFTTCGSITLAVTVLDGFMQFEILDTGPGISEHVMSHLYQPYIQELRGRDPYHGTGLGLAISKHVVELHGGTIHIESELGVGTRVGFTIPLATEWLLSTELSE